MKQSNLDRCSIRQTLLKIMPYPCYETIGTVELLLVVSPEIRDRMSLPSDSVIRRNPKERLLRSYLLARVRNGNRYFKAKFIARDLSLSSKEIGALMVKLQESDSSLEIEQWSRQSPATWFIRPRSALTEPR